MRRKARQRLSASDPSNCRARAQRLQVPWFLESNRYLPRQSRERRRIIGHRRADAGLKTAAISCRALPVSRRGVCGCHLAHGRTFVRSSSSPACKGTQSHKQQWPAGCEKSSGKQQRSAGWRKSPRISKRLASCEKEAATACRSTWKSSNGLLAAGSAPGKAATVCRL